MRIAITGHRPNKLNFEYDGVGPVSDFIRREVRKFITDETEEMISGMALGVDMLFAELAIELNIPLVAAIPCKDQEKIWPPKSQLRYNNILKYGKCTKYLISEATYDNSCMQKRNIWMVDRCDRLIAAWDGTGGGTGNCVKYAKEVGKPIVIINPMEFKNDPNQK